MGPQGNPEIFPDPPSLSLAQKRRRRRRSRLPRRRPGSPRRHHHHNGSRSTLRSPKLASHAADDRTPPEALLGALLLGGSLLTPLAPGAMSPLPPPGPLTPPRGALLAGRLLLHGDDAARHRG